MTNAQKAQHSILKLSAQYAETYQTLQSLFVTEHPDDKFCYFTFEFFGKIVATNPNMTDDEVAKYAHESCRNGNSHAENVWFVRFFRRDY